MSGHKSNDPKVVVDGVSLIENGSVLYRKYNYLPDC